MEQEDSQQVITVKLRISPELRDKIAESAKANNRSMNADMNFRLEKSFESDIASEEIPYLLKQIQQLLKERGAI